MTTMERTALGWAFWLIWLIFILAFITSAILFRRKTKKKWDMKYNLSVFSVFLTSPAWFIIAAYTGRYGENIFFKISGIILMLMGQVGYLAALVYLGNNWSMWIEIKDGHALITDGPYKIVRHPMYFSMMLVLFGSGLAISNYVILIFSLFAGVIYYDRAKVEEEMLKDEFPEYDGYSKKVKMIIPGVF